MKSSNLVTIVNLRVGILTGLLMFAGCGKSEDPRIQQFRQQILTSNAPANPASIAATLSSLEPDSEVTIVGRIYGGETSPFDSAKASFSIIELPEPGHNHDDPGDCPFCKHKLAEAAMAIVQVCDSTGATLDMPADKLLGLSKNQDLVVTGRANKVGEVLMIQASSIHSLAKEAAEKMAKEFAANMSK